MSNFKNFRTELKDGVFTATLDVPGRPVNVFEDSVLIELHQIVQDLQTQAESVQFVAFRSGKKAGFLAGADIHRLESIHSRDEAMDILHQGQQLFNSIENLPMPTLAIVHGACVGGGLEFVMACRYRMAVDDPSTKLGLPEVKLGLIPAWGGTQRLPKLVGLSEALPMMLQGKLVSASKAKRLGLVDEVLSSSEDEAAIREFVDARRNGKEASHPRSLMGWVLDGNPIGRTVVVSQARKESADHAAHYPALKHIIDAAAIGAGTHDVTEEGLLKEREAFADLLLGDVAPNLIRLFLLQEQAKKTSTWTGDTEGLPVNSIAVIGAGTMGAGIAQLAASRGYRVALQDIEQDFVDRGMKTIRGLFGKAVEKRAMTQADADEAVERLHPRVGWGEQNDADLMIEAILEKQNLKDEIFEAADERLPTHAVLASNTSALPIDKMAAATERPEKVAGLHFFNPVHKMPLVEVVRASSTSESTIATLVGVAKKLGKVPIVVKQSPGFLVNRILFPYLDEAARLVLDGYAVADIDREAKKFGMPMGPLELLDVVGIDVAADVAQTLGPLAGETSPATELFQKMVAAGNRGQKSGSGFYIWNDGKRQGPADLPVTRPATPPEPLPDWKAGSETLGTIQQRLVLAMINEAQKCLNEEIVAEPWMVNLGMVLGTGFAPFRGGPLSCRERWGEANVRTRLDLLQKRIGSRFAPAGMPGSESSSREAFSHQTI